MRQYYLAAAVLVSTALTGCGGGSSSSDLPAKPKFTAQVTFGDSLSDVGSYKVGPVAGAGGGQFTINIPPTTAVPHPLNNWTEMIAPQLGLAVPCAAITGGFGSAASPQAGCYGYAQGGARISADAGIGNGDGGYLTPGTAYTKAMTLSISRQIASHPSFTGTELVFVMGGANDVLIEANGAYPGYVAACMGAGRTGCVGGGLSATAAQAAALQIAQGDMQGLADALVNQVTANIIGRGAKYVVVANVPDIANTPLARTAGPSAQFLFGALVTAFNTELKTKLAGNANVLLVDANTANHDEVTRPEAYSLTNIQDTACNIALGSYLATYFPTSTLTGSSLGCTPGGYPSAAVPNSLIAGVAANTHYLFADDVHPTPYGHALFSMYMLQAMTNKGWY